MDDVKKVDRRGRKRQEEASAVTVKRLEKAVNLSVGLLDNLITAETICEKFGISTATVYRLMDDGLPSFKIRGSRKFSEKEVAAWLGQRRTA